MAYDTSNKSGAQATRLDQASQQHQLQVRWALSWTIPVWVASLAGCGGLLPAQHASLETIASVHAPSWATNTVPTSSTTGMAKDYSTAKPLTGQLDLPVTQVVPPPNSGGQVDHTAQAPIITVAPTVPAGPTRYLTLAQGPSSLPAMHVKALARSPVGVSFRNGSTQLSWRLTNGDAVEVAKFHSALHVNSLGLAADFPSILVADRAASASTSMTKSLPALAPPRVQDDASDLEAGSLGWKPGASVQTVTFDVNQARVTQLVQANLPVVSLVLKLTPMASDGTPISDQNGDAIVLSAELLMK